MVFSSRRQKARLASLAAAPRVAMECLESRQLFAATVVAAIPSTFGTAGGAPTTIDLRDFVTDPASNTVEMVTATGTINIQTFDQEVPINARNFNLYVRNGLYNNAIFPRSVLTPTPFVLQGGGDYADGSEVPNLGPILSEPNGPRSNIRGTLAFARVGPENGGGPNTATNQFFFNLSDNSANLDFQNGGFTVFGQVLDNGMDVVDALAALPNAVDRRIISARIVPDMTYAVSSSDPSQVSASVDANGVLSLGFTAATSEATITVMGTDLQGNTVQTTFEAAAGLRIALGGASGNKSVTYTQADGTVSTVSVKGNGTATLALNGLSLAQETNKGKVSVSGSADALSLDVTGSDAGTRLTIATKGGTNVTTLGGLTTDGAVKSISGKRVRLAGPLSTGGAAGTIALGDVNSTTLTLGGTGADRGVVLTLGTLTDTAITAASPIRSLKMTAAVNNGSAEVITAPGIDSLSSSGNFAANVTLPGEANLRSMKVGGNMTSNVTAHQVGSLSVKGDLANSTVMTTHGAAEVVAAGGNPDSKPNQGVQSVKVGGAFTSTTVNSAGTIGAVSANSIAASLIVAGAPSISAIPTSLANIPEPASILSLKSKTFASTFVIARNLGKLSPGTITTDNNGNDFGFYGGAIASLPARTESQSFRIVRADAQADVDAALTGVTPGDLMVRVLT